MMLVIPPVRRAGAVDAYEARIGIIIDGEFTPAVIRAFGATEELAKFELMDIVWRMHGALCDENAGEVDADDCRRLTW